MNTSIPPARFLFTTWEGGGNVAPAITLAKKLRLRGHHVRFMSDLANRHEAEAAGLEFRPWKKAPSRPDRSRESCPVKDWEASSPPEGIARLMDKIMLGAALDYAQDLQEELDQEPADVVVTSEMLLGIMAACESRGQRMAVFTANLCFYPLPGMPAFGPGLPPPSTPEEEALHDQVRQGIIGLLDSGREGFNHTRQILGLPPLEHVTDQIHAMNLFLLGTSRAFDFPVAHLPEKLHYIGPQLDEPAWVESRESPWPIDDDRPRIAVGFSTTYQAHEQVLQTVVDAAAALPVNTLVTLGQIREQEVRPAANTILVAQASHNAVMKEASIVVTHGGHGTVMRALMHHRPLLIIPHGRDQDENAIRVSLRGAGLTLPATATSAEIEHALSRLLKEPSFALAAEKLGRAIAQEAALTTGETLLEELAKREQSELATA